MIRPLLTFVRRQLLLLRGAQGIDSPRILGASIDCRRGRGADGTGRIAIGRNAWIESGVVLHAFGGNITIGSSVFLGPYAVIYGHGDVSVGDDVLISMHCRILSSDHAIPPPGRAIRGEPDVLKPTQIGRDVWLGAGVTVLGGITIGDGCVVGAGAVVDANLPANSVAVGVPARVIRQRA